MDYLAAMRRVLPRDGFFVEEICQAGFNVTSAFRVYTPRSFRRLRPPGTLGFGYATSLGVRSRIPTRPWSRSPGDGGFMFGVQELATAVQYGIGVVAVVFNNHAYGNVRRDQQQRFGGASSAPISSTRTSCGWPRTSAWRAPCRLARGAAGGARARSARVRRR